MPDHVAMHVQFSSGVTVWQRVLKRMVNTSHIRANSGNKMMCSEQTENCFRLNPQVFASNKVKLHYLSHFWLSQLYKVVWIHTSGEVDNFHVTLLGIEL